MRTPTPEGKHCIYALVFLKLYAYPPHVYIGHNKGWGYSHGNLNSIRLGILMKPRLRKPRYLGGVDVMHPSSIPETYEFK